MGDSVVPKVYFVFSLIIFALIVLLPNDCNGYRRPKRFLLFPRTAPTRMQIISGIGIPVDLRFESLTMGYVFKAEYFLPENTTNFFDLIADPFNPSPRPIDFGPGRRRREVDDIPLQQQSTYEKNEKYNVEAMEVETGTETNDESKKSERNDNANVATTTQDWYDEDEPDDFSLEDIKLKTPHNLDQSRFTLYKGIEKLAETSQVPGRPCLLRSICETAEVPFTYSNGILGELAHLIMTPSSTADELSDHSDNEYLRAEQLGKSGAPCDKIFKECPTSVLSKFSGIYETLKLIR